MKMQRGLSTTSFLGKLAGKYAKMVGRRNSLLLISASNSALKDKNSKNHKDRKDLLLIGRYHLGLVNFFESLCSALSYASSRLGVRHE